MQPSERPGSAAAGEGRHRAPKRSRGHLYLLMAEFYASIGCMILTTALACYSATIALTSIGVTILLAAVVAGCAGAWCWDAAYGPSKRYGGASLSLLAVLFLVLIWFVRPQVLAHPPEAPNGIARAGALFVVSSPPQGVR